MMQFRSLRMADPFVDFSLRPLINIGELKEDVGRR
jgi:hypothetical protein